MRSCHLQIRVPHRGYTATLSNAHSALHPVISITIATAKLIANLHSSRRNNSGSFDIRPWQAQSAVPMPANKTHSGKVDIEVGQLWI